MTNSDSQELWREFSEMMDGIEVSDAPRNERELAIAVASNDLGKVLAHVKMVGSAKALDHAIERAVWKNERDRIYKTATWRERKKHIDKAIAERKKSGETRSEFTKEEHRQWQKWANVEWNASPELTAVEVATFIRNKHRIQRSVHTIRQVIRHPMKGCKSNCDKP